MNWVGEGDYRRTGWGQGTRRAGCGQKTLTELGKGGGAICELGRDRVPRESLVGAGDYRRPGRCRGIQVTGTGDYSERSHNKRGRREGRGYRDQSWVGTTTGRKDCITI